MKKFSSKHYYDKNPASKAKKYAYNKEYNKKPSAVRQRVKDNKANRDAGTYGNGDGLDAHKGRMIPQSVNRGLPDKNGVRHKGKKNANSKGYRIKTKNGNRSNSTT